MKLTGREKDVIHYVLQGLTNKQIAQQLFISPHTVKMHVSILIKKLKVYNKIQMLVSLIANNYITKEEIVLTNKMFQTQWNLKH